jgi:hypothetical protein
MVLDCNSGHDNQLQTGSWQRITNRQSESPIKTFTKNQKNRQFAVDKIRTFSYNDSNACAVIGASIIGYHAINKNKKRFVLVCSRRDKTIQKMKLNNRWIKFVSLGVFIPGALLQNINAQCTPPPSGLVSWWRAKGNTLDAGADGYNGTLIGNVTYGTGEVGQGFVFNGYDGSGVNVGAAPGLQLQNLTIECWIKRSSASVLTHDTKYNSAAILSYGSGGYQFGLYNNGCLMISKVDYSGVGSSTAITDTKWHHIAVTQNGSAVVFYIDGVAKDNKTYQGSYFFNTSAAIGCRPDILCNGFYGEIDELAVYNQALTGTQIANIYRACPKNSVF